MSKMVSVRLESELAAFVEEFARAEGFSRSQVINDGLRTLRERVRAGAPVALKPPKPPTPDEAEAEAAKRAEWEAYQAVQAQHLARQERLNEAKQRASGASR